MSLFRLAHQSIASILADCKHWIGRSDVSVCGWVRSVRMASDALAFVALNDGSCQSDLQLVVALPDVRDILRGVRTGVSLGARGAIVESAAKGQVIDMKIDAATGIQIMGTVPDDYPLAKARLTLDHLRPLGHLRVRTATFSAVARVRHSAALAIHKFFDAHEFFYVHTPLMTGADCEGGGENFQVVVPSHGLASLEAASAAAASAAAAAAAPAGGMSKSQAKKAAEKAKKEKAAAKAAEGDRKDEAPKDAAAAAAAAAVAGGAAPPAAPPAKEEVEGGGAEAAEKEEGKEGEAKDAKAAVHDPGANFFGRPAYLTVSGQLHVESYASALSRVYTFGPTFRAEPSDTSRHLAEFWMVEPEVVGCGLTDLMNLAEDFVKAVVGEVSTRCAADIAQLDKFHRFSAGPPAAGAAAEEDGALQARLAAIVAGPFARVSFAEAQRILLADVAAGKVTFAEPVVPRGDLKAEHERYLCEKVFGRPTFVTNYPAELKAFYMRRDDDPPAGEAAPDAPARIPNTVQAMDLLVPGIGELVGGSVREERADLLSARIAALKISPEPLDWYVGLRRAGTVPHAGFGLGFERLIMLLTGMGNIKDVIPFPRWWRHIGY